MRWRKTNRPIVRIKKNPETANQIYDSVWFGPSSVPVVGVTVGGVTVGVTVVIEPNNKKLKLM